IGLGALVGLPPLAGFWSKDAILYATSTAPGWLAGVVLVSALTTVVVTAWYATRLWLRTCFGTRRTPQAGASPQEGGAASPQEGTPIGVPAGSGAPSSGEAAGAHDPPPLMLWPVVALAVPSALLGLAALVEGFLPWLATPAPVEWTGEYLPGASAPEPLLADQTLWHLSAFVLLPLAAVALGVAGAWALWRRDPAADPARALGPLRAVFARGFYLDELQHTLVVRPVRALARAVRRTDQTLVDGVVEGTGRGTTALGAVVTRFHRAALPRAATALLAGALLAGLAAAVWATVP